MYEYCRVIHVEDTDASGVIFFTNIQKIALEAFEEWLFSKGVSLDHIFRQASFLLPIVHAEANYLSLVSVGDRLCARMTVYRIGSSSFTVSSQMINQQGVLVATVSIVHVVMDKKTNKSCPIPEEIRSLLQTLMFESIKA